MHILWFVLAAVLSLASLAGNWFSLPVWFSGAAIVLAGLSLVMGFYKKSKDKGAKPIELSGEQTETIRTMKSEGRTSAAIQQVLLWCRGASNEDAARVVREL